MKFLNKKILYYLGAILISTFNGSSIKNLLDYKIVEGEYIEYFLKALIFGYLLTAIINGGIFVSSSLIQKNFSDIAKKNYEKLFFYSSVCAFCIILFFKFIKMTLQEY